MTQNIDINTIIFQEKVDEIIRTTTSKLVSFESSIKLVQRVGSCIETGGYLFTTLSTLGIYLVPSSPVPYAGLLTGLAFVDIGYEAKVCGDRAQKEFLNIFKKNDRGAIANIVKKIDELVVQRGCTEKSAKRQFFLETVLRELPFAARFWKLTLL